MQILSPRTDIGVYNNNKMKKKKVKEGEKEKERRDKDCDNNNSLEEKVEEHCDPATIVSAGIVWEGLIFSSHCGRVISEGLIFTSHCECRRYIGRFNIHQPLWSCR